MSNGDPKETFRGAPAPVFGASPRVWLVGSASDCDVVVTEATVSRRHCRLLFEQSDYWIEDLHSSNGTYVNGVRIRRKVKVQTGQVITLGRRLPFPWDVILDDAADLPTQTSPDARVVRVGRNSDNDIVLDVPGVSSYHAHIILLDSAAPLIEDLGSMNGTALNHVDRKIRRVPLSPADWIFFGAHKVSASELLKLARESRATNASAAASVTSTHLDPSAEVMAQSDNEASFRPELASVFFTDIVSFTKMNPLQQMKARLQLENYVQAAEAFLSAKHTKRVIIRPTGDGMALVFFTHPSEAAKCAVEVARMIAKEGTLAIRMGINEGTVYRLRDMNGNEDVSGRGINMAQRVMDGADSGEICISASVAEALRGTMEWHEFIRPIGMKVIKHGESIEVFGLCGPDFGKIPPQAPGQ